MRLTNGAITNLIANYKAVLGRMFVNNKASCKKRAVALLACLIMTSAAPVMGATPYIIDPTVTASGNTYNTLDDLFDGIGGYEKLETGDTITFSNAATDDTMSANIQIDTSTDTVKLVFDGEVAIEPSVSGGHQFITVTNGANEFTFAVDAGSDITISGFKSASTGGAISGGNANVIIGEEGSGKLTISHNDSTTTGGAIHTTGDVIINGGDNTFEYNTTNTAATNNGGAIWSNNEVVINGEDTKNTFANNTASNGGAIRASGNVIINNGTNLFESNNVNGVSGGGAIISNSSVIIYNGKNTFSNNTSENGPGGAITAGVSGAVEIHDGENNFIQNSALSGGAIRAGGTNVTISIYGGKNTFTDNSATTYNGGAIAVYTSLTISGGENTFKGNNAIQSGGAISADGTATVEITGGTNIFGGEVEGEENTAGDSGGAISAGGDVTISGGKNTFTANEATVGGGAVSSEANVIINDVDVQNGDFNKFIQNKTDGSGGAISAENNVTISGGYYNLFDGNIAGANGGAINSGTVAIGENAVNVFTGNEATLSGGAIQSTTTVSVNGENHFIGNTAGTSGGAINSVEVTIDGGLNVFGGSGVDDGNKAEVGGGAIHGNTSVAIEDGNNWFIGNTAEFGGAVASVAVTIGENAVNVFTGNEAAQGGGAIQSTATVSVNGENHFIGNTAGTSGGAINSVEVTIDGGLNVFGGSGVDDGNKAEVGGGAIHGDTLVEINDGNNWFIGNTAEFGGAVASVAVTIGENAVNVFTGNEAVQGGGAIQSTDTVSIDGQNHFIGNTAGARGGAINSDTVTIVGGRNVFGGSGENDGNKANGGGGGAIAGKELVSISGGETWFQENSADDSGGAIASGGNGGDGHVTIEGIGTVVYFINNRTVADGGAIAADGDVTFSDGAIVYFSENFSAENAGSSALIANKLILENGAILAGNGEFMARAEDASMIFSDSTIALDGTISLNTEEDEPVEGEPPTGGKGEITFTDMTLLGNGILAGNTVITIETGDDAGLTVNTNDTITISSQLDIGEASLIKDGAGTLNLTNNDNIYNTGTLNINAGVLAITVADDTEVGSPLEFGTVNNSGQLSFVSNPSGFYQKFISINEYNSDGANTVELQASLTNSDKEANWSDQVTVTGGTVTENPTVNFTFESGSIPQNMPDGGLLFATVNGVDGGNGFELDDRSSTMGAYKLVIKPGDDNTFLLNTEFDRAGSKVYSEAAAAGLGQAAWMHGRTLFNATNEAARDASANNTTGVFAGYERVDSRFDTGSHADVKGNNFTVALGFKASEKTTWGLFGQMFTGDYDTSTGNAINSSGDLDAHDFGLFVEYRPAGQTETGAGHYYKGIVRAGRTTSDFRANNGLNGGYSTFSMGRNVFGMSFGGGYVKAMEQDKSADFYTHLIYTGLNGNTVTDSLRQEINFGSSSSFRILTGARLNFNKTKKTGSYLGAALDYEFSGTTDTYINGLKAEKADLKGLTGILELGLVTKPNATTAINLGLQGYVGKKQGLGGTLSISKLF